MILETNKIRLELTRSDNISKLIQIENENSEFIGQYDFSRHLEVIENKDEMHLSIFDKSDNLLIGHIILAGIENENKSIEFRRIVISKKGCGFGREAVFLIKKFCFGYLGAHRIWLDVLSENERAIGLYKSQGFITERVQRDCIKLNGELRSLNFMSILKNSNDWKIS
jgi:RimJ/RimL family protein N-acetyltransferase